MPLPFSFFGSKHHQSSPDGLAKDFIGLENVGDELPSPSFFGVPTSPFPKGASAAPSLDPQVPDESPSDSFASIPTVLLPEPKTSTLPTSEASKGLAGLVIRQSEKQAPPLNRRSPFPSSPLAAFSPLVSLSSGEVKNNADIDKSKAQYVSVEISTSPLDEIRRNIQGEIDQVKNDLFGAVMGVSALKDRLDGLEAQISRIESSSADAVPPAISQLQLEPIIHSWLNDNLSVAIERMLADAQQRMLGAAGAAFFRSSVHLSEADRQTIFSQPPLILNSIPA